MELADYLTLRSTKLPASGTWSTSSPGLLFVFPRDGIGSLSTGNSQQNISAGDVLVFCGQAGSKLTANGKTHLAFSSFSICFENLYPLFGTNELRLASAVEESFKKTKFYPGSDAVSKECHKLIASAPPQFNLDHRTHLLKVVANVLNLEFRNGQSKRAVTAGAEEHVIQVFDQLSVTEILTLSVGDLAVRFGCSRRHLNRLFHEHFSMSVAAMRMEMRLLKAISLLRDPEAKIISVAEQCGFNHLGLFNTCFKRRFGNSPGQWRKSAVTLVAKPAKNHRQRECPLHLNGLCPLTDPQDACESQTGNSRRCRPAPDGLKTTVSVKVFSNAAPSGYAGKRNARNLRGEIPA